MITKTNLCTEIQYDTNIFGLLAVLNTKILPLYFTKTHTPPRIG